MSSFSQNIDDLTIVVTARGNDDGRREMALAEYARMAEGFRSLAHLRVSGGARDPLLRGDLADIVAEFCRRSGVGYVTIETGLLVDDAAERVLCMALRAGDATLRLSMDVGTGDGKAFGKLSANCRRLNAYREELPNLVLCAVVEITGDNADRIKEIIDLASSLEVDAVEIMPPRETDLPPGVYEAALEYARNIVLEDAAKTRKDGNRLSIAGGLKRLLGGGKHAPGVSPPATKDPMTIDPFGVQTRRPGNS
jgi:molybdenum cofactor biosynthesis enzyme MoaA